MTDLRRRMIQDMQLRGLSEGTQRCYVGVVQRLAEHYHRSPATLSQEEIRGFFLHLINDRRVSSSTVTTHLCAIKFFFETTLGRRWRFFELVRPTKRRKLPVVLSPEETRRLLAAVHKPIPRMALMTIYSCGLRLSEGTHLLLTDIDSRRMVVRIRNGKGAKDRHVPLPHRTLQLLRAYWRDHQPSPYLFPKTNRHGPIPNGSWVVYSKPTVQGAETVLTYLARYVHRIAITNNRILSAHDGTVTFRYKDSHHHHWNTMTLSAPEFIRRFLQHVLPKGFHKVRYYGLLSPSNRHLLRSVKHLAPDEHNEPEARRRNDMAHPRWPATPIPCPVCSVGVMVIVGSLPPRYLATTFLHPPWRAPPRLGEARRRPP